MSGWSLPAPPPAASPPPEGPPPATSIDPAWSKRMATAWSEPLGTPRNARWTNNLLAGVRMSFHVEGLQVVARKFSDRWEWSHVRGLAVEDSSRVTATRMATLGLIGLGLKKRCVLITFIAPSIFGDEKQVVLTVGNTSLAEVESQLRFAADRSPDLASLLVDEPPASAPNPIDQLERLVSLQRTGALTDEEFTRAKDRLLGG